MNNELNFVFLKNTYNYNGDERYASEGPIFHYLSTNNVPYTLNGKLDSTRKNLLLIESRNKFQSLLDIPDEIYKFILDNNVKLLYTSMPDPCNESTFILGCDYIKTKLPKNKYYLVDSNTRLPDIFTFDFFLENEIRSKNNIFNGMVNSLGYISEEITKDELNTFRNKKFLCFNRTTDKEHRISLLYEYLTNDYSDSYFTFLLKTEGYARVYGVESLSGHNRNNSIKFFNKHLPIELDTFNVDDKSNFSINSTFKKELFLNSCINLVTETSFEQNELFISEKVFKPIINFQPFIVFSSYGYLNRLRSYGFKTFGEFWDESYDEIENSENRFKALLQLIGELNSKSIEELNELYKNLKHICIYNKELFDSLEIDTFKEILKTIENEW